MNKVIRVAQIIGVASNGGVESIVMNYYKNIDRSKVQFDFLVESESQIINKKEIESMGGRVIFIPSYKSLFKYNRALKRIFKENKYDIIHSNMNTLSVFPLRVAKKCGAKIRIAHSHSTSNRKEKLRNFLKNILRKFSKIYATHYFACSEEAGRYQFGDKAYNDGKVAIINNAIDFEKFKYNETIRKNIRKEYGVENNLVIGHVGRFVSVKNHSFLIDVFSQICKKEPSSCLLLVGEGPLQSEIVEKVESLGLKDKVIFAGSSCNVAALYNAMDVFAFPSLYEGLGMALIEAQINGTKCVYSQAIPKEAIISDKAFVADISNEKEWVSKISENFNLNRSKSLLYNEEKFDIRIQSGELVNKYIKILKEE